MTGKTKQCAQCKEFKALSEFSRMTRAKDGLKTWCKKCCAEHHARWYIENREKHTTASLAWKRANPKRHSAGVLRWTKAHPDRATAKRHRRRALKLGAPGSYTDKDIKALYDSQGGRCVYSNHDLSQGYEVDHIVPLKRGGSNWPNNLALACQKCNRSKKDKLLSEWVDRPPRVE